MTLVGVNVRRTLQLLLAVVLLFGATSVIASQRADAAYPGGNEWIVFVDSFDIWAIRADGTGLTNLTNTPGELEADPAFSADGTKIAYAADPGIGESAIYIAAFQNAGTLTPSLGAATQVSSGPIDGAPTWSPAGDYVAYQRKLPNVTGTATTDNAGGTTLIDSAAAFDTTDRVAVGDIITNTTNGSTGAVVSVDSATQITMTALTGGTAQTWTTDDGYSISHINRQIFKSATTGSDLTGTRLSQPDSDLTYTDQDPAWSADGTKIAFTSTQALGNADILTMSATDGSSRTNLTDDTTSFDHVAAAPCWSPDSSRVAFQIATTDNENIWTVAAAGGSPVQVTTGTGDEVDPAWSPDGTLIAFRNATDDKLYVTASGGGGTPTRVGSAATPATNSAPDWRPTLKAVADTATVAEGGSVNIDVLANDLTLVSNVGTATTSSTLAASPTKGTAVRQGDGSFLYTHSGSEIGASSTTDTFTYTLTQGALTSTAVVTVTITPVNDSPTAVNDEYSVANGGTLTVTAANGVLANDSDPEGVTLTAAKASDPAHGTLTLNGNGSFTYVNDGANTAASTDSFTYTASDGANTSAPATVTHQRCLDQSGRSYGCDLRASLRRPGSVVLVQLDSQWLWVDRVRVDRQGGWLDCGDGYRRNLQLRSGCDGHLHGGNHCDRWHRPEWQ